MNTVGVARGQSGFPLVAVLATALLLASARGAAGQPGTGEVVIAWHVTIAPSWFDPSTALPQTAPFGILYALHDALVRPLPGQRMGPSLAESWKESPDGLTYEFKLRRGLKFHNGDPLKRRPSGAAGALRPPRDRTESTLAAIWKDVLHLERIGINDRFLDLGGDSLRATQILGRTMQAFGIELSVSDLIRTETIAQMAELIAIHVAPGSVDPS